MMALLTTVTVQETKKTSKGIKTTLASNPACMTALTLS